MRIFLVLKNVPITYKRKDHMEICVLKCRLENYAESLDCYSIHSDNVTNEGNEIHDLKISQ